MQIRVLTLAVVVWALAVPVLAQSPGAPEGQPGSIVGTVIDANNDTIAGATVVLQGPAPSDHRTVVANDTGFFEFQDMKPGIPYHVVVSAKGFANWRSPVVMLEPGQYKILTGCQLMIETAPTTVIVTPASNKKIATAQVQAEVKQRVLGIVPNFYVNYDRNPQPLTTKLKFKLAFKAVTDPITVVGVALYAGLEQAGDTPNYGQGAQGYGKRFGANAAGGFTDIMIGGAILPSLLHQDPRYFFQGTGTNKSRVLHALSHPFVCKGDNGNWEPNYSSLGGDLASSAISDAYYPQSDRGAGLIFGSFALNIAEREVSSLLQEFVLHKLTRKTGGPIVATKSKGEK